MTRLTVLILLSFFWMTSAEAVRCGNLLVSEGDSEHKVVARCGDPVQINQREEPRWHVVWSYWLGDYIDVFAPILVEEWIYDFGSSKFMRRMIFENGELKRIERMHQRGSPYRISAQLAPKASSMPTLND